MNKTYRKVILGLLIAALVLGGMALFLRYAVFQGMMASKEPRSNTQCQIEERVFDEANVLADEEEEELSALIEEKEKMIGADIVLLTIREPEIDDYYTIRDYAQNWYETNQFGWDKPNGDGIIYVITGRMDIAGCVRPADRRRSLMIIRSSLSLTAPMRMSMRIPAPLTRR